MSDSHTHIDPVQSSGPVDFERQLLDYQSKIANILESFTDAFFEMDKNWIVTYWNKEAERLMLMPRAEVIGRNIWEVYQEAVVLKFYTEYHRAVNENVAVRFEEFFAPRNIWVEVAAFPSDSGLSVYFKDITANKLALSTLESERKKYNDLFNLSPVPQWVYDYDTLNFLDVNEAAVSHYGYSREEFLQMSIKEIRLESDVPALEEILSSDVVHGIFSKSNVRHQKKNGEIILVCVEGNSIFFEGRNARLVMVIDRTAEIKAGKDLEESLLRFDIVSKATRDAIWDWNMSTGDMLWNRGIAGIFGYLESSYTKQWWEEHVHPDDLDMVLEKISMLIRDHKAKLQMEYRFRCADGSYRFVLDRAFIVFDEEGEAVRMIGSMQDITTRVNDMKSIEAQNLQLREISWIQSHKVRSPLSSILGLVGLIEHHKTDLNAIKELVPMLAVAAEQLDKVLQEIVKKAS